MLKIISHDGPSRNGLWNDIKTPTLVDYKELDVIENIKTPFKIQKEIAEEYMEDTIKIAENETDKDKVAVIQGAMYSDLRVTCAEKLTQNGFNTLVFANTDELQRNPKDLLDIIIKVRQNINPNVTLIFPFATTQIIPILAYIGIDVFDTSRAIYEAKYNNLMTNSNIYNAEDYEIVEDLEKENLRQLIFTIKEVQENIKNRTLRNLTEQKANTNPELMTLHRLLDKNYPEYLEEYTQLY